MPSCQLPTIYTGTAGGRTLGRAVDFGADREFIREWLIRSLLKRGTWGSGLDTLLTELRKTIKRYGDDRYPLKIKATMRQAGKSLAFESEELDQLADMRYRDRHTFALLSLLFPFVDLRQQFHVDHVFPQAQFARSKLRRSGVPDQKIDHFVQQRDGLANLQLLSGAENIGKHAKAPSKWMTERFPEKAARREYQRNHMLEDLPSSILEFDVFYKRRRSRLRKEIQKLLG